MCKPLVAITPYNDLKCEPFGAGGIVRLRQNYGWALAGAGLLPMLTLADDAEAYAERCEGLLLSGGGDVRPCHFGETPWKHDAVYDDERDELELRLIEAFMRRKKPILGICRGIQVLNVALGGTLWQDIGTEPTTVERHGDTHDMTPADGSLLRTLFGAHIRVNSFHHQAVRALGRGLVASAVSADGLIEAVEHETDPIWGVQWHPERAIGREENDLTDMRPLFTRFARACGVQDEER